MIITVVVVMIMIMGFLIMGFLVALNIIIGTTKEYTSVVTA